MGIIVRQGLKSSIVTYVGVAIGIVNVLVLYNLFLTPEQLGLYASTLLTFPLIYMSFALLGVPSVAVRFHSRFPDETSRRQLFTFMLAVPFVGLAGFVALYLAFKPLYLDFYLEHSPLLVRYYYVFIPLTAAMVGLATLEAYSRIHLRIVVPSLIREIGLRLGNSVIVLLFGFHFITFDTMVSLTVATYLTAVAAMVVYLYFQGNLFTTLDFGFVRHPAFGEMWRYGLWVILAGVSVTLMPHIEKVLLPGFDGGLTNTAIFDIASRIALVIAIPRNSIAMIGAPIIARAFQENDLSQVNTLYKKSSLNLFIIGTFLLLGVWVNIDSIFTLIPHSELYAPGKWVVLMVGLSRIADMATGLNSEILTNSRYYRYDIVFILAFTLLLLASNFYLIPRYGYNGAAAASLFSVVVYNAVKLVFIQQKLAIQPFTKSTFQVLILAAVTYGIVSLIPAPTAAGPIGTLLDLLLRSVVVAALFGGGVLIGGISADISAGFATAWEFIRKKRPRN